MKTKLFRNRSFLTLLDFNKSELEYLLALSEKIKNRHKKGKEKQLLEGKNIVLLFEKASTRTRCAFEVAAHQLGADVTYLGPAASQMGVKESIKDTARVLGRMYDGIEYRGFGQNIVEELARYSGVPVWNGLTNEFHPTQIMADLLTIKEHSYKPWKDVKLAYIGDARNNVANSLMIGSAIMGIDFRAIAPVKFQPKIELTDKCIELAKYSKAKISISENINELIRDIDFIYTDVWLSMGEPEEKWKERIDLLLPYQVNMKLLNLTGNPVVKFMHCLPAFHNRETTVGEKIFSVFGIDSMEVTGEVFESKNSIVFDQAENRLHTIKAIMLATLGY